MGGGFRWLAARDNPQLPGEWLDSLDDYARPLATRRAVLRLYRAEGGGVDEDTRARCESG